MTSLLAYNIVYSIDGNLMTDNFTIGQDLFNYYYYYYYYYIIYLLKIIIITIIT
jgi:hypothetical protein